MRQEPAFFNAVQNSKAGSCSYFKGKSDMYEFYIRWAIAPKPDKDGERHVRIELKKSDFSSHEILILIQELMAVRDRLKPVM